ncbi:MAG: GNAT family N-acetyltransferase [Myxococcota bacterium]|nr:GNAT family N-acetyltransferase [Myxococcota bacterium]
MLGLAITKNGPRAKLCHISVSPSARNRGLGGTLMQHALRNMAINGATEIRVTTSEEVYRKHAFFFGAAGFRAVDWQVSRYRRDVSEVLWQRSIGVSQEPVGRSSQESRRPISYDLNDVQLAQKCPNTIAL